MKNIILSLLSLMTFSSIIGQEFNRVNQLITKAIESRNIGNCDSTTTLLKEAINLGEKINDTKGVFYANYELGVNYSLCKLEYDLGYKQSIITLKIAKQLKNPEYLSLANNLLGALHYETGEYTNSLLFYQEVIKNGKRVKDKALKQEVLGKGYINLSSTMIALAQEDTVKAKKDKDTLYDEAGIYLTEFIETGIGIKDNENDSKVETRLKLYWKLYKGLIYCSSDKVNSEKGISLINEAIYISKKYQLVSDQDDVYFYCGKCLNNLGENSRAIDSLKIGLKVNEKFTKNKSTKIGILKELSDSYAMCNIKDEAYDYLIRANTIEGKVKYLSNSRYDQLQKNADFEEQTERDEMKLTLFFCLLLIVGGIIYLLNQLENNRELKSLNAQLNEANEDYKCLNNKLNEANVTKEFFVSILAHQSKGRISTLKNQVLSLKRKMYNDLTPIHKVDFDLIEEFVTRLNNTFSNILVWAKPTTDHDLPMELVDINLEDFFNCKSGFVKETIHEANLNGIKVNFDFPSSLKIQADQRFLRVILRNITENAIKYSHASTIKVYSKELENQVELIVEDDGVGIPMNQIKNDMFNFDLPLRKDRTVGGFGFKISNKLARQQGGYFKVISKPSQGTKIVLTCKKTQTKNEKNKSALY